MNHKNNRQSIRCNGYDYWIENLLNPWDSVNKYE